MNTQIPIRNRYQWHIISGVAILLILIITIIFSLYTGSYILAMITSFLGFVSTIIIFILVNLKIKKINNKADYAKQQMLDQNEIYEHAYMEQVKLEENLRVTNETLLEQNRRIEALNSMIKAANADLEESVHELIEKQEIIEASEKRYKTLFENIGAGFAHCKLLYKDDEPFDLLFITVNSNLSKMTGIPKFEGRTLKKILPEVTEKYANIFSECFTKISTGQSYSRNIFIPGSNRSITLFCYPSSKDEFILLFEDTTDNLTNKTALLKINKM